MEETAPLQILLTGASGYIGGTILRHLVQSPSPKLVGATITCLVRGEDRVTTLTTAYGSRVRPVLFDDLDDLDATTAVATQHDLVINTTLGFHPSSGTALLRGLAQRKAATGRDVWLIHTSGTSNLADQPISGIYRDEPVREFDDATDDVYSYEKARERQHPYAQRTAELAVIDTGIDLGVKTLVIMSPTIYGVGTGLFNQTSIQIPMFIKSILKHGKAVVAGDGEGVWDHVHVEDLAELYLLATTDILESNGKNLPTGQTGIIFSGNGRHSWKEVAQNAADACYNDGKLNDRRVESVPLAEAAKLLMPAGADPNETMVELGVSSNSKTVSSVARRLGWKPTRGERAWGQAFQEDLQAVLRKM